MRLSEVLFRTQSDSKPSSGESQTLPTIPPPNPRHTLKHHCDIHISAQVFFLPFSSTWNLQVLPPFHPPVPLLELPYFHNRSSEWQWQCDRESDNDTFYCLFSQTQERAYNHKPNSMPRSLPKLSTGLYLHLPVFLLLTQNTAVVWKACLCLGLQYSPQYHRGVRWLFSLETYCHGSDTTLCLWLTLRPPHPETLAHSFIHSLIHSLRHSFCARKCSKNWNGIWES